MGQEILNKWPANSYFLSGTKSCKLEFLLLQRKTKKIGVRFPFHSTSRTAVRRARPGPGHEAARAAESPPLCDPFASFPFGKNPPLIPNLQPLVVVVFRLCCLFLTDP